jgi:hypothetical protein
MTTPTNLMPAAMTTTMMAVVAAKPR